MAHHKLRLLGAAAGMMILILDSRAAALAAAQGLDTCIRTVIPSLFPFFLLSGFLTSSLSGGKNIARLFHCPEHCGSILITGFLGGYPLGAKLVSENFGAGIISKKQADRMLRFCSQAGPSFLFGLVGPQLGNQAYSWMLWLVLISSAFAVSWLLPGSAEQRTEYKEPKKIRQADAMQSALRAMASVCGWVIIFHVVISFLSRWVFWCLPETIQILLSGLMELTTGCMMLHQINNPQLRFLVAAVMINFGGLCVLLQTHAVARNLDCKQYILGKCLQVCVSMLLTLLIFGQIWILIPLLFVASLIFPFIQRKKGSIPVKIGV